MSTYLATLRARPCTRPGAMSSGRAVSRDVEMATAAPTYGVTGSPTKEQPMPKLRVHAMAMSIDGYVAGPGQDLEHPLGVGGPRLHEWVFETRTGRAMIGQP